MEKILTVAIPSYNVSKYLDEILPTFLCDEIMNDIEILIVNDGSKDNTAEIASRYEEEYKGVIRLINKENGGHGSTINRGIEEAKGKYFKVVDGDDWVDSKEFIKYVEALKNIDADAILTPFNRVNIENGEIIKKDFSGLKHGTIYKVDDIICELSHKYQMHSITFKSEILKKIPKIRENCFYVDQEYVNYPLKYIDTIAYLECTIYQYRVGNNEQSISFKNMQKNRNMHMNVFFDILSFYEDNTFSKSVTDFLIERLSGLYLTQMRIFFSMDINNETKKEVSQFTKEVKKRNKKVYNHVPGKKMLLMRITNNMVYSIIARYVQRERN